MVTATQKNTDEDQKINPHFSSLGTYSNMDQLREQVFQAVPPLQSARGQKTVAEYLAPMHQWVPDPQTFPLIGRAQSIIHDHVSFYFGADAADSTINQLNQSACIETGTHLSFPRDKDFLKKNTTVDNTMVWQGAVLSAMSYKHNGMKHHLASPSGIMSINNSNGPLYLQFGRTNFLVPIVEGNRAKYTKIGLADPLSDDDIDAIIAKTNTHIYNERIQELQVTLSNMTVQGDERLTAWSKFVNANKGYSEKNEASLKYISHLLSEEYGQILYDYTDDLERLETITSLMTSVVHHAAEQNREITLSDQLIVVQKYLMDEIMPEGIDHITWDISKVACELMIEQFRNPESIFYQIFDNPELKDRFVEQLGNNAIGWVYDENKKEAPFLTVRKNSKGILTTNKIPYDKYKDHLTPETIAKGLEDKSILPVLGLDVIFTIAECGMMFHGGMFQCQYAPQYAHAMAGIMDEMGLQNRADALRSMPLDIPTQSLAFALVEEQGQTRLARYSDFLSSNRLSSDTVQSVMAMPAQDAMTLAAPSLLCFLNGEDHADPQLQSQVIQDVANKGHVCAIKSDRTPMPKRHRAFKIV